MTTPACCLPPKTPSDFRAASAVFKALSNPNRLLIVDALGSGERCVADLTALVGLDMSTVSNPASYTPLTLPTNREVDTSMARRT